MTDIRKLLKDGVLVLGTDVVLKRLKKGEITKVLIAKNYDEETKAELNHYQKIAPFEIEDTGLTNEELGVLCKKPFSIALIGVLHRA